MVMGNPWYPGQGYPLGCHLPRPIPSIFYPPPPSPSFRSTIPPRRVALQKLITPVSLVPVSLTFLRLLSLFNVIRQTIARRFRFLRGSDKQCARCSINPRNERRCNLSSRNTLFWRYSFHAIRWYKGFDLQIRRRFSREEDFSIVSTHYDDL